MRTYGLVDNEQRCAIGRSRSVRRVAIAYVVALSRIELEGRAVLQRYLERPSETEQYVTLAAPVIGSISGRILHHTHSNIAEILRSPERDSDIARVLGRRDAVPVDDKSSVQAAYS